MSQALQRVIVRMLHDPPFVEAIYGGCALPELSAAERAMLVAVDRRAWATDPYRRSRLLQALIEEYPASSALASRWGSAVPALDAYLSSPSFHRCIQERGYVALAYGRWLVERVGPVAEVELALAEARRPRDASVSGLVLGPGVVPVIVRTGAVALLAAIRERLGPHPVETLVGRRVDAEGLPSLGDGEESLLVEGQGITYAPRPLVEALSTARRPTTRGALLETLVALGAGDEAEEILDGLVHDGVLVQR